MWLLLHGANLSLQCVSQELYRERVCACECVGDWKGKK